MNLLEEIARAIVSAHTADLHGEVDPSIVENEWVDWLPEARSLLPIIEKAVQAGLSGKSIHTSDCATSNAPAMAPGPCNCDAPEGSQ